MGDQRGPERTLQVAPLLRAAHPLLASSANCRAGTGAAQTACLGLPVPCILTLPAPHPRGPGQTQVWQGFSASLLATHRSLTLPWRDWAPPPAHMWDMHLSGVGLRACHGSQPEEPASRDHKEGARLPASAWASPPPHRNCPGGLKGRGLDRDLLPVAPTPSQGMRAGARERQRARLGSKTVKKDDIKHLEKQSEGAEGSPETGTQLRQHPRQHGGSHRTRRAGPRSPSHPARAVRPHATGEAGTTRA
ncbi:uncharacterized protein LOC129560244 [Moschus berezovskii]|uniref:uncharacterized protein LOC129560244 n=1 Tax=Moschus berezovskii TaxID=68408 RepID=UPI0024450C8F|nr:uncharacterized protein LOC129560244 [Moschus berezovskii]